MNDQSPTELNYNCISEKDFKRCRRMVRQLEKKDQRAIDRLVHTLTGYDYSYDKPQGMLSCIFTMIADTEVPFPELSDKENTMLYYNTSIVSMHQLIMERLIFCDDSCDFLNKLPQYVFCNFPDCTSELIDFAVYHKRFREAEIIMRRTKPDFYMGDDIVSLPITLDHFFGWIKDGIYEAADAAVNIYGLRVILRSYRCYSSTGSYYSAGVLRKLCRRYMNRSEFSSENEALCEMLKQTGYADIVIYCIYTSFNNANIKRMTSFFSFLGKIGYKTNDLSIAVYAASISDNQTDTGKTDKLLKEIVFPIIDSEPFIRAEAAVLLNKYRGKFFYESFPNAVIKLFGKKDTLSNSSFLNSDKFSKENGIKNFPVIIDDTEYIRSNPFIDDLEYTISSPWVDDKNADFCEDFLNTLIDNSNLSREEFNELRWKADTENNGKELKNEHDVDFIFARK
ncbi:MAG: hypothetical protein MSJ26_02810 [Oscillospiraceae bacterium]|nr:hypothetical protein [Oscillospiraceae bacterium]